MQKIKIYLHNFIAEHIWRKQPNYNHFHSKQAHVHGQ